MSTPPVFDIAYFAAHSTSDLRTLISAASAELKRRESSERDNAMAQILDIAKSVGMSVTELVGKAREKGQKVPARYAHPENPALLWTGRGRQPKWVEEQLASGKPLSSLLLAGASAAAAQA